MSTVKKVEKAIKDWMKANAVTDNEFKVLSGKEWKARGETCGLGAYAVVITEGTLNHIVNMYSSTKLFDSWAKAMDEAGLNWELAYGWAIAFYKE